MNSDKSIVRVTQRQLLAFLKIEAVIIDHIVIREIKHTLQTKYNATLVEYEGPRGHEYAIKFKDSSRCSWFILQLT